MSVLTCAFPLYPWVIEASLLCMQGFLSYMHDAHFQGRSPAAGMADRTCATFLTLCQPLKLAFCRMDASQLGLLLFFWKLGLFFYFLGGKAKLARKYLRYQFLHTMWHVALPLGGYLWIEYTVLLAQEKCPMHTDAVLPFSVWSQAKL